MKPTSTDFNEHFPFSTERGSPSEHINSEMMRQMTESKPEITEKEFAKIMSKHKLFIENGGLGGTWETLLVANLVMGIYYDAKPSKGKQADFFHKNISKIILKNKNYSTANFIASIGENVDISNSVMKNCIFTDAYWSNSNFENCDLQGTDFSRSDMRNCNFRNCNLENTDFENCNLEGSDFTGAKLFGSKFPGAILKDVKY